MNIGRTLRTSKTQVPNQTIADLALQADQERRAAVKRGDHVRAEELRKEVIGLIAQLH